MRATRHALTAAAAVAVLALAGCGEEEPSTSPVVETTAASPTEAAESPSETTPEPDPEPGGARVEIVVDGDSVLPIAEQVELQVGDTLTLVIDADRAGELHVHSTPEQIVEFTPASNEYELIFDKPGTVDIEEHESGVLLVRALVS